MRAVVYLLVVAFALAGCGGQRHSERIAAPAGPADVGLVVDGWSEAKVSQVLRAYPGAQVRRVNPAHGIYEFFHIQPGELEAVTGDRGAPNRYFTLKALSIPGPDGVQVEGLNRCKVADRGPEAILTVDGQREHPETLTTMDLGKSVQVEVSGSTRSALVVVGPANSQIGEKTFPGPSLKFTPDALGAYRVFGIVQNENDICAMEMHNILATANRPMLPIGPEPTMNVRFLSHLRELDAPSVWKRSEGEGVLIAIIDSGVNYNHPLLAPNMELNKNEVAGDEDLDHNGFKGDVLGYDFVNNDPFPFDDDGHGSHVAGLAAGRQFGIARKAHILAVKTMTSVGGDMASVAAGVFYAVDRGAQILNLSLGTMEKHPLLLKAVAYAEQKGVLIVTASGNGDGHSGLGFDIDKVPQYPASLESDSILTVGASDDINPLAPYSNFGIQSVDIVAPGGFGKKPLVSATCENPQGKLYGFMSGTSMAAPLVSGTAADVWSRKPALTALEVKNTIMSHGTVDARLDKVIRSGRHLNARSAVESVSF